MLGVIFKVGSESGVCRIPWTTVDTSYIGYELFFFIQTRQYMQEHQLETSGLTRSRGHHSHRCGLFERCQNLINMLMSKKIMKMGQMGTGAG